MTRRVRRDTNRLLKNLSSVHLPLWERGIEGDF